MRNSLIEKIFREINYKSITSIVKPLLSRNFCHLTMFVSHVSQFSVKSTSLHQKSNDLQFHKIDFSESKFLVLSCCRLQCKTHSVLWNDDKFFLTASKKYFMKSKLYLLIFLANTLLPRKSYPIKSVKVNFRNVQTV